MRLAKSKAAFFNPQASRGAFPGNQTEELNMAGKIALTIIGVVIVFMVLGAFASMFCFDHC